MPKARRKIPDLNIYMHIGSEPFPLSPQCASPVVAGLLRHSNGLDEYKDWVRHSLKQYIPRLIGACGSDALEERRSFMAADWATRVFSPAWLRLSGLTVQADALASLPEITSMAQIPSIKGPSGVAFQDASVAESVAKADARSKGYDATSDAAAGDAIIASWCAARFAAAATTLSDDFGEAWKAAKKSAKSAAWRATYGYGLFALVTTVADMDASMHALIERMLTATE